MVIVSFFTCATVKMMGYGMLLRDTPRATLIFKKLRKILKYGETRQSSVAQRSPGAA